MKRLVTAMLALGSVTSPGDAASRSVCNTTFYGAHDVASNRCRSSLEVMVGITRLDPLVIRCARLQVFCTRDAESPPSTPLDDQDAPRVRPHFVTRSSPN